MRKEPKHTRRYKVVKSRNQEKVIRNVNKLQHKTEKDRRFNSSKTYDRKEKQSKIVVGKNANEGLKAATLTRVRVFHVTRLSPDTTEQCLTTYIKSKEMNVSECVALKARHNSYASFKVSVTTTEDNGFDCIYDASFWPVGVMMRRYFEDKVHKLQND